MAKSPATDTSADSLFQFARFQRFTRPVWTILIGTFIARFSYYMAWPFLIIILNKQFQASAITIGLLFSISATVSSVSGIYIGYLSDKIGRKRILMCGCLIAAVCYSAIGLAQQIWHFFAIMTLLGLVIPMVEVTGRSVIGDSLEDPKDRELAFNFRYFLLNAAGAVGPLIGLLIGKKYPQLLFFITGLTYLMYIFWVRWGIERRLHRPPDQEFPHFIGAIKLVSADKIFMIMLLANFIMLSVYAQADSTLQQIITMIGMPNFESLLVSLTIINTATVTILQFPMLKLLERVPTFKRTRIGMWFMLIAQALFMGMDKSSMLSWGVVFTIFSLGEVIAFPNLNVQIDMIAKPEMRGTYFGAASLARFGFAVGPLLGGIMIELWHPNWFFAFSLVLCAVMIWLYVLVERYAETHPATQKR